MTRRKKELMSEEKANVLQYSVKKKGGGDDTHIITQKTNFYATQEYW